MCISKELIEDRINNFWGYGNLKSRFWFVSMEEGTNGNLDELKNRFLKTKGKSVLDCKNDMLDVPEHIKFYSGINPPLQSTISKLIRVLLNIIDDGNINTEDIRKFQRDEFGRLNGNHCSLEFMPLPVPKTDMWIYDCVDINYLSDRDSYNQAIMMKRIKLFSNLINKYKPEIVIFYSLKYFDKWKMITDSNYKSIGNRIWISENTKTKFFIIPHPQTFGLKNKDWDNYGKIIKKQTN